MAKIPVAHLPASEALAREVELLEAMSKAPGPAQLWFWETDQALVAPWKFRTMPAFGTAKARLEGDGWPIHLRATGGDVTPQGPGVVNVTHVYATEPGAAFSIAEAYGALTRPIVAALGPGAGVGWQPGAFCDGAYNVSLNGRKFAGTAMRFRPLKSDKTRHAVLAHALMLIDAPTPTAIGAVEGFLDALGEDREIRQDAHTGLPPSLSRAAFLEALVGQFRVLDPSLELLER
ncbi:MAG: protein ligase [Pseudomonadota bacterium]